MILLIRNRIYLLEIEKYILWVNCSLTYHFMHGNLVIHKLKHIFITLARKKISEWGG